MSFLNNLKNSLKNAGNQLGDQVARFKSNDFADAAMAMCALIAAADGQVDAAERSKTAQFIMSNDALRVFNAADLKTRFDKYCDKLTSDYDFGRIEVLQVVGKLRSKPDQARAVIQLGIVIGGADGDFEESEMRQVRDAANATGLNPSEFGV
ncbi:tellurite resistance TerB family protein [Deinococcus maricopensis]|uniref:Tellurite resistance TerB n=1 Tax=Deinococcus maricopensis (strain DSM 21211 / LMG 22137 / NRRL B-23946 / LB-34) TaxID=709986 RepID=E8U8Q1_DEIML|nr:TerB family tellurite resistance protein [Deinococcus maricopensis]ADV67440.1 Tellurite resistance TerB [Deinococcus maricopensis DSM 21211]